jgi:hypothetical protein
LDEDFISGLYLIDDMIEFMNPNLLRTEWPMLVEALLRFSMHEHTRVRQPAIYGLGCIALNTGAEEFAAYAP